MCGGWRPPVFGEGRHNLHHADPTSARHGALHGQWDLTAGLIRIFERLWLGVRSALATQERLTARRL